jgi:RNA polymerase sigma-70 factor (ECF subfamily)
MRTRDREKGRFRSFLLGTLKHFVADVRDRGRALKRGGGMILQNLDDKPPQRPRCKLREQQNCRRRKFTTVSGQRCFLRQALDRLAQECALAGKAEILSHLMPYLSDDRRIDDPIRRNGSASASAGHDVTQ